MAGFWGAAKEYSAAIFSIPGEFASAGLSVAGGQVLGPGGLAAVGSTVTTTTTTTGIGFGAATTTTTVTATAAASAGAIAGAIAIGIAAGTGIAQILDYGLSSFWDPVQPVETEAKAFSGAPDSLLDGAITEIIDHFLATCGLSAQEPSPDACGYPHASSVPPLRPAWIAMRQMYALDAFFPGSGQAAYRFCLAGARAFVHAMQGAALATSGLPAEVRRAADALKADLKELIAAVEAVAAAIDRNPALGRLLPPLTLQDYLRFIERHKLEGAAAVPEAEAFIVATLLKVAGVRYGRGDIREDIAKWIAEGPGDANVTLFQARPDRSRSFAEILRGGIETWSRIDLEQSPLLATPAA